jgi:hypothetical protein
METAGEGGAWGIALLADFLVHREQNQSLEDYLDQQVFNGMVQSTLNPDPEDEKGFDAYMKRFVQCIPAETAAVREMV